MKKIIVISGKPRSGKDTIVNISRTLLADSNVNVYYYSSVDEIKKIAIMMGWDGVKDEKSRLLLCNLKKLSIDFNNGPLNYLKNKIDTINDENAIIFLCIREGDEIDKIKSIYNDVICILVRRDECEGTGNDADATCEDYAFDYIICNNGTIKDLIDAVKVLLDEIGVRKK